MACNLTKGYATNCKDVTGGIVRAWMTNFGAITGYTIDSNDQITNASGTATFFQYELKNSGNTMVTTATVSRDTGTSFFSTVLTLVLPKLTKELQVETKLISYGRPHIIVEDRNSNFFWLGRVHGNELTSASISTGGAMSDLSGTTLEFTSEEVEPPMFISGATSANPVAGLSGVTETITVGTNS